MEYETKQLLAIISIPAFALLVIGIQLVVNRIRRRATPQVEEVVSADASHEHHAHPA